jgi:glutamate--cysteine ligase
VFDIRLPELRPYAFEGNFGLERESLRVTEAGRMAQTPHPFPPDHPRIVRDFCENQTEINTDVAPSAEEAQKLLAFHTRQIHQKLVSMDEPEYMWPFSNPPFIRNERDIPIAHHNSKAEYSEGYREYLANRY